MVSAEPGRYSTYTSAPLLGSERLLLRPETLDEFERIAALFQTDRSRYMDGPMDRDAVWNGFTEGVAQWALSGLGCWAIERRSDGATIGQIGLNIPASFPEPELGWLLFDGYEGHGYATEAAGLALEFARRQSRLKSLVSYVDPDNGPSIHVAERLGAIRDPDAATPNNDPCLVFRHTIDPRRSGMTPPAGQIVILNGAPRSGKSSIVTAVQAQANDLWVNLGVDVSILGVTPEKFRPGIGLRPGGEAPELEPRVVQMFAALYESIAAHSRLGINVVAEFGHHDAYSKPLHILPDCARRLSGLPVLFVGVHCALDEIMRRRNAGQPDRDTVYETGTEALPVPPAVQLFQDAVHKPGIYDLEVDTTHTSPESIAVEILDRIEKGPPGMAFATLAKQ